MMDTLHSGSEFDCFKISGTRRYSTYTRPSVVERLHDTTENNTSFPLGTYDKDPAIVATSSGGTTELSTPRLNLVNEPDIELHVFNPPLNETCTTEPEFSLPPVDGGKDAWFFLLSAFVLEILVWGTTPMASTLNQTNWNFTNLSQASLSLLVYSKNITPRIHRLPGPET
jgi:hypothetical protein